ncbi:peptide chain release factor 3 [Membranihabitans marinus]|uniref:peptide chain release factor 3 n=1 Tax=Membranihabitans marinus TaxID=1227546 RepID=UPI001F010D9C|nr:peptide chain release factor 3 [Membranihabitans marinus]
MSIQKEIEKRKTFGIISHPDAGKTTLTEKLLLFGGAIQTAGAVKSNKIKKHATSDFMEIEKQRGISVATSVMGFEYMDLNINILDTPGHKDFAEDTYRTLSAVDSVIVVIDVAKGVESQTEKLVQVSRMRNIPIIVFINKLDREGKDPVDLMDEVEEKLGLNVLPLSWPIGMGQRFKGVYNIFEKQLVLFNPHGQQLDEESITVTDPTIENLTEYIGQDAAEELIEELEMVTGIYDPFEKDLYLKGEQCPVFFGSAINNFGVKELLDCFVQIAPNPLARVAEERTVIPSEEQLTGFIFKIHANMDPNHRDRIAFLRICSGKFERNKFYHHVRKNSKIRFSNPTTFMASKKELVEESYPGDIVGLYDSGNFKIGDSLTEGESLQFKGIPRFSPELFRYVINKDPMRFKQLDKGLRELMDEGVAQLFVKIMGSQKIIGTVGALQFDVIKYRLDHEYGANCDYQAVNIHKALWIEVNNKEEFKDFEKRKMKDIAKDKDGNLVYLAETAWSLKMAQDNYPGLVFHESSEF